MRNRKEGFDDSQAGGEYQPSHELNKKRACSNSPGPSIDSQMVNED